MGETGRSQIDYVGYIKRKLMRMEEEEREAGDSKAPLLEWKRVWVVWRVKVQSKAAGKGGREILKRWWWVLNYSPCNFF